MWEKTEGAALGDVVFSEIEAARAGSEPALASIIARRMDVIRRAAARAAGPGLDMEDAIQEGLIGLFHAIETFHPAKNASFSTYSAICIQNAISTARKTAGRKKHAPLNQSVPLTENESIPGPEEQTILNEQVSIALSRMKTRLSSRERTVLRLSLAGYARKDIARRLGLSLKSVENALLRARKKLKS